MAAGKDASFDQAVRGSLLATTCPLSFWDVVARREEGDVLPAVIPWLRWAPWVLLAVAALVAWGYGTQLVRSRDAALVAQAVTAHALGVETAARQAVTAALIRSEAALAERQAAQRALEARQHEERGRLEKTLDQADVRPWAESRVPADVLARLRAATAHATDGRDPDAAGRAAD